MSRRGRGMEENHMGWRLVSGVRADLVNLFKLFSKTNSIRYEDFCKVWKELNFSLIYRYRVSFLEVLEFTEEIFQIAKEYLFSVYEFSTRVAALYTLYGLYFKQPIRHIVQLLVGLDPGFTKFFLFREAAKIRFTKSEWEVVTTLISQCKVEKQFDVVFVHLKMYVSGAYNFTATPRTSGLEMGIRKYAKKRLYQPPNSCDLELLYRPIINEKLVNSLVQLESLYCTKKTALLGKRNLEFIDGNFATSLRDQLRKYASKCQKLTPTVGTSSSDVDQPDENEGTDKLNLNNKCSKRKVNDESNEGKTEEEKKEENSAQRNIKDKLGKKFLELSAKKKAELFIQKLREKYGETQLDSDKDSADFSLPDLDD